MSSDIVTIPLGARVLVVGDSLCDDAFRASWWSAIGNAVIAAQLALWPTPPAVTSWRLSGHPGMGVNYFLANIDEFIFANQPTHLFLPASINDHVQSNWADYLALYRSLVTQVRARLPDCLIIAVDCAFGGGEKWSSITGWGPNSADPDIDGACIGAPNDGLDPQLEAVATEFGLPRWRIRELILAYEQANNSTPVVGDVHGVANGIITDDGIHPTGVVGRAIMAGLVYPSLINIPGPVVNPLIYVPIH